MEENLIVNILAQFQVLNTLIQLLIAQISETAPMVNYCLSFGYFLVSDVKHGDAPESSVSFLAHNRVI